MTLADKTPTAFILTELRVVSQSGGGPFSVIDRTILRAPHRRALPLGASAGSPSGVTRGATRRKPRLSDWIPPRPPGNLWFCGQEGAFRYDGKTLAAFTSKDGLLDDFVGSMIIDRAGNLWLGHPGRFPDGKGGGASRFDGKSLKRFTQNEGLSSLTVYCMLEDKAGNIWYGIADAGASRYDGKTFTNFSATNPPPLPARPAQAPANDQTSAIAKG